MGRNVMRRSVGLLMLVISIFMTLVSLKPAAAADDWPQFRGPSGDGHSAATGLPLRWSETENIRWKVAVPGRGWSSPVVRGEKIWVTTAIETAATEAEKKERLAGRRDAEDLGVVSSIVLRAISFDRRTGRLLQNVELFRVDKPEPVHWFNSYASPTPVLERGRLYCHFGTLGTSCVDTTTGDVLWTTRFARNHFGGPGSSPFVHGDLLVLVFDGYDRQFITAVNKNTRDPAWTVDRPPIDNTDGDYRKGYNTPIVARRDGREQMIVPGSQWVVAYDPATGGEIWRVDYGKGYSTIPRPTYRDGVVYVCTGFGVTQLWAIRIDGEGDVTKSHVAWKWKKQVSTRPSPILVGEHLYMVSDNGVVTCLDAATGEPRWQRRVGGDFCASPVYGDGHIYFFGQDGKTTVIEPGSKLVVSAENQIDERILASPAIVDRAILIRTDTHLYCIEAEPTEPGR